MRTINKSLALRLSLIRKEAETQGLVKTAEALDKILNSSSVRKDDTNYTYSSAEYAEDVRNALWQLIVRTADFCGSGIDVDAANNFIASVSEQLTSDMKDIVGAKDKVIGKYEPVLPGEVK
jgi:hypothetical protein